jgi:Fe-S cluster assembly iron-binding protein IscA
MTDRAATTIRMLASETEIPDEVGLRIATDSAGGPLSLSLEPAPRDGDEVLTADGALLFLDDDAAGQLADKTLDAHWNDDGQVVFVLLEQPA